MHTPQPLTGYHLPPPPYLPTSLVSLYTNHGEVGRHRPRRRAGKGFGLALATAKPGDIICIASPDRLARRVDDLEAIIRYCEENGLVLITAAVGRYVGAPAFVLSAGDVKLTDDQSKLLKDFQAAVLGFQGIAEVFADDKAVYRNEWRTMTRCV